MSFKMLRKVSSICRYCTSEYGVTFLSSGQGLEAGRAAALAQATAHRSRRVALKMLFMSSQSEKKNDLTVDRFL